MLVAAPTGSGKTVVGEFAVHLALAGGQKCFYTTPIKALSNQKYNDLVRRYDSDTVGLLTGDNAINGDAPVIVMTTEVLRNMLYAGSPALKDLGYVVLDEVHHGGDALSWGDAVREAFDPATRRLALTGTPFRSDTSAIPFGTAIAPRAAAAGGCRCRAASACRADRRVAAASASPAAPPCTRRRSPRRSPRRACSAMA